MLGLRNLFDRYFREAGRTTEVFEALPPELKERATQLRRSTVVVRGVSDSIIIGVPFKNEDEFCTPMNGVFSSLFGLACITIAALAMKHPIRGAVEVGVGLDIGEGEVYGPALERAWYLESEVAAYPRVLLGTELLSFVDSVANRGGSSVGSRLAAGIAGTVRSFVTIDSDGLPMLDFLGRGVLDIVDEDNRVKEMVKEAARFVRGEHERHIEDGDWKLAPRYGRLRRYVEARLPIWGLE